MEICGKIQVDRNLIIHRKDGMQFMKDKYMLGCDAGFSIVSMVTHSSNVKDGYGQYHMRQSTEMIVNTPFMLNGKPVMAHIDVQHAPAGCYKDTYGLEFYDSDGHNLDYMPGKNGPTAVLDLCDKNGVLMNICKVKAQVCEFASSATDYPHVFTMSEYMESRNATYERNKANHPESDLIQPPNPEDYDVYLESMQNQLRSRDFVFVGDITNIKDFNAKRNGLYDVPGYGRQDEHVWDDDIVNSFDGPSSSCDFGD